jgi:predicted TPR repeat methyltransferase
MLFESGDPAAAGELMLNALELAPAWALGWFRLGEMYEVAGQKEPAIAAWRTVLKLDPDGQTGAVLKLELAGAMPKSAAPPGGFVEALFDQYAETFDASLVQKLGYRVPDLLLEAVKPFAPLGTAIDLGCGTGLMGEKLRPLTSRLEGYDISAAMLKKAEAKKVYDRLGKADLQALELSTKSADLIIAADVFMYVGALDGIARRASTALKPGGIFAFSVEQNDGPEPFRLRDTRRYAHSEAYTRDVLHDAGLAIMSTGRETIRKDRGEAIEGLIILAKQNT